MTKRLKSVIALVIVAVFVVGMVFAGTACKSTAAETTAAATTAAAAEPLDFVVIAKFLHPWFEMGYEGAKLAASEMEGVNVRTVETDPNGEAQAKLLENIIAEKPDGIAMGVIDANALKPVIDKAIAAGIPVVTWDDTAPESKQLMYFGTANFDAGVLEGIEFEKLTGGKANYIIVSSEVTSTNSIARQEGIHSVLDKNPDMKELTPPTPTGTAAADASKTMENLYSTYGDELTGFMDTNLQGTIALHQILKDKNVAPGKIKIVTWTLLPDITSGLDDGYFQSSIEQNPFAMGYLSVYGLKWAPEGKAPTTDFFDTGAVIATKDNYKSVYDDNKAKVKALLEGAAKLWK